LSHHTNILHILTIMEQEDDVMFFFFSSRRRHTRWPRDWSSDVCSSDLVAGRDPRPTKLHRIAAPRERRRAAALGGHEVEDGVIQIGRASCRERVEISVVAV